MEVHHHSHTAPAHGGTGRKKWTHYFWEFLMLFLAVFCGFLAEYQLEHKIEHQREKKYIKTFVSDLKNDTGQTKTFIPILEENFQGLDSLMAALKAPDALKKPENIYRFAGYPKEDIQFISANRTMEQVKHSGNMRLIQKAVVSDSLMMYDHFIQYTTRRYEIMTDTRKEVMSLMDEIIDESFIAGDTTKTMMRKSYTLLTKDRYKLDILYNKLIRLKQQGKEYAAVLQYLSFFAGGLITLLQKEYHIK